MEARAAVASAQSGPGQSEANDPATACKGGTLTIRVLGPQLRLRTRHFAGLQIVDLQHGARRMSY